MVKYSEDTYEQELNLIFSALADPTRRKILDQLTSGEQSVLELAEPYKMSLPAISKHLKVLEKAQLIDRKILGRTHHISLNPTKFKTAKQWLEYHSRFWESKLEQLKTLLEKDEK